MLRIILNHLYLHEDKYDFRKRVNLICDCENDIEKLCITFSTETNIQI